MILKWLGASQAAKPRGFMGRFVGRMMAKSTRESNKWVVSLMDLKDDDRVLEIGFGPGTAIQEIFKITKNGHVAGIDISKSMVDQATSLNEKAVTEGRLDLRLGDVKSMPWPSDHFDKALAVNVIYLWPNLAPVLSEIRRVLKLHGTLALYLAPIETMEALGFSGHDLFTIHTQEEAERACKEAGFAKIERASVQRGEGTGVCIMAWKSPQ